MSLSTYDPGDSIDIPVTFTNPTTRLEPASVPDAMIQIFKSNVEILPATPLTQISGGRYLYVYSIPLSAPLGVYTVYITGTVNSILQTATMTFSVSDNLVNLQNTANSIVLDITASQLDMDTKFATVIADIGTPTVDGTNLHAELKTIISDIGNPLLTGQDITQKLDDIRTAIGLTTPIGSCTVSGLVLDENGHPLAGVRVIAINTATGNATNTAITATNGSYSLNLNPGTYVLQFVQATTILNQSTTITIPALTTSFTVPHVILTTKRTVTDLITDEHGHGIPDVLVKATLQANYNAMDPNNMVVAAAFTNAGGNFSLDLFPGIYVFQFVKTGFDALPETFTVV